MTEVRSLEEVKAGVSVGKAPLATCSEEVKAAQIALIHERVEWLRTEPDEKMKPYWKGMAIGEINLMSRLELISQHEWMVLVNMLYLAAGEREPHGQQDLSIALRMDSHGVRIR
jgi:hypothetical protein